MDILGWTFYWSCPCCTISPDRDSSNSFQDKGLMNPSSSLTCLVVLNYLFGPFILVYFLSMCKLWARVVWTVVWKFFHVVIMLRVLIFFLKRKCDISYYYSKTIYGRSSNNLCDIAQELSYKQLLWHQRDLKLNI